MKAHPVRDRQIGAARCAVAVLAVSLSLAVLLCATIGDGAEAAWKLSSVCWFLVVAGVTGTAMSSSGCRFGWLLLVGLQPLWIAYALCTDQTGLIAGSLAYGVAQYNGLRVSWRRARRTA